MEKDKEEKYNTIINININNCIYSYIRLTIENLEQVYLYDSVCVYIYTKCRNNNNLKNN